MDDTMLKDGLELQIRPLATRSSPLAAAVRLQQAAATGGAAPPLDILHLAELVPIVRTRFALSPAFTDDAILASLRMIAAHSDDRRRWTVAFNSNLGATLAHAGRDLNTALNTLLSLLPRPLS